MSDKMITAVYGTLSVTVWGCTMALLIFIIILFCAGRYQSPVFSLRSVTVSQAPADDAELKNRSKSPEGWYKAVYEVTVEGAKFSPYTYTAGSVAFKAPDDVKYGMDHFLTETKEIEYSRLSPCDFTLTLYVQCGSEEKALDIAGRSAFGLRNLKQSFAFFYTEIVMNLPGFAASDFPIQAVTVY